MTEPRRGPTDGEDPARNLSRRRLLYGVGGLGALGAVGRAGATGGHGAARSQAQAAQEGAEALETFDYAHEMNVNGEQSIAEAQGTIDASAGRLVYEGAIDEYIKGYRFWAGSAVTLAIISGASAVAAEYAGGRNAFTLTDGELGYEISVRTSDQFADLETTAAVRRDGDTLVARLETTGQAGYPDLVGMSPVAMRFEQTPTGSGFVETGTKRLRTADGEVIESTFDATYDGVPLDAAQVRDATIGVRSESVDRRTVELEIENSVSPLRESTDGLRFAGLEHATVGDARLSASAESLAVDGDDAGFGVSVALDDVPSLVTTPAVFDTDDLPSGASMRFEAFGAVAGTPDERIATLAVTDRGDEAEYAPDFSDLGADRATVRVFDDGELLTEVTGVSGAAAFVPGPIPCDPIDPVWIRDDLPIAIVEFPFPREIRLANDEAVVGDELRAVPEGELPELGSLSEMRIVADGPSSFTVVEQAIGAFERPHAVFGDAVLDTSGDGLTVAEFGERSGLRVRLDDEEAFRADLDPLELAAGTTLTLRASGLVDGRAGASLGSAAVAGGEEEYVVSAGFAELDTGAVRLAVFDGGRAVGATTVEAGEIARLPRIPVGGCGKLPPRPLPCFLIDLVESVPVRVADGTTLEGDQLRVLPTDTDVSVESLSEYALVGSGLDAVTVVDEQVQDVA